MTENETMAECPHAESSATWLRWEVGIELPPFVASNVAACSLLKAIVDGTIDIVPKLHLTDAVAAQIWLLVNDAKLGSALLNGVGNAGMYVMLASLALGTRTLPPDIAAIDSLRLFLSRPTGRQLGGLITRFRRKLRSRDKHPSLRGKPLEEAQCVLLCQWDLLPFGFDFGVASGGGSGGGGGGGDGDGGGGFSASESHKDCDDPAARPPPMCHTNLDIRVRALAAASIQRAFFSLSTEMNGWPLASIK